MSRPADGPRGLAGAGRWLDDRFGGARAFAESIAFPPGGHGQEGNGHAPGEEHAVARPGPAGQD